MLLTVPICVLLLLGTSIYARHRAHGLGHDWQLSSRLRASSQRQQLNDQRRPKKHGQNTYSHLGLVRCSASYSGSDHACFVHREQHLQVDESSAFDSRRASRSRLFDLHEFDVFCFCHAQSTVFRRVQEFLHKKALVIERRSSPHLRRKIFFALFFFLI